MSKEEGSTTLAGFNELIDRYVAADGEVERIKKEILKPAMDQLASLEQEILSTLEQNELKSFRSKLGTVTRVARFTVTIPKTLEEKTAFFKWLSTKGQEVYWDYATVNHQKLNSLFSTERDIAISEGNYEFKIPGIADPTASFHLSFRKKV